VVISHSKKFLFVHIQKTAGRSFEAVLKENIPDLKSFMGTHDHALWAREQLGPKWPDYYKVAFVRNPWERLVSWYTMIQEKGRKTLYKRIFGMRKYNLLTQYVLSNSNSFDEFLYNCVDTIDDIDGKKSILYNQLDYITDSEGSLIVDFVGKFENLNNDTDIVFKTLGLDNVTLPHKNSSKHRNYRSYYSEETKKLVSQRFERDIEFFGYEF
jgi:hypothetical protein